MKVLSGALLALVVMVAGLSASSPAAAEPYPRSITTVCRSVPKPKIIPHGDRTVARLGVRVAGNVKPRTWVYVVGVRAGAHKVVFITKRRYRGVPAIMHFRALPPGNYTLRFATSFGPESVFKNCHSRFLMHVSR